MSYTSKSKTLIRAATDADHLRKSLQSDDPVSQVEAADRMLEHPQFVGASRREILAERGTIPLKQFRHVVAMEHGFDSWEEFKKAVEDLPEQTYDVRIYHAGDWDRICTFRIEAPTAEIAERLGLRRAQEDYGPGEFEAEIDDGEPWQVPGILRGPQASRPASEPDENAGSGRSGQDPAIETFTVARPGSKYGDYVTTGNSREEALEGMAMTLCDMLEGHEYFRRVQRLYKERLFGPAIGLACGLLGFDGEHVPDFTAEEAQEAKAALLISRREAYEALYEEYEFSHEVADSDGAYTKGRAMWRTVYLEVEGLDSTVPVTYTIVFLPGSIEPETERVSPGHASKNEPSHQEVLG